MARSYSQSLRNDLEFAVDAHEEHDERPRRRGGAQDLRLRLGGLAVVGGRRALRRDPPEVPGGSSSLEQFEFDMNTRYASIVQAANANGVTIWALDASGLAADDMISAENRYMENRPSSFLMRQNTQAPLQMMAEQTGGTRGRQHERLEGQPRRAREGLLQLLLDRLPNDPRGRRPAPLGRGAGRSARGSGCGPARASSRSRSRRGRPRRSSRASTIRASDNPLERQPVGRGSEALRPGELPPAGPDRGPDRQARAGSVRRSVRGPVLRLLRGSRRLGKQSDLQVQRQAVSVPAKDFTGAQQKDFYYDVQLIVVPGGQKLVGRAARRGLEPDLLSAEERLRLGAPQGDQEGELRAGVRYGRSGAGARERET